MNREEPIWGIAPFDAMEAAVGPEPVVPPPVIPRFAIDYGSDLYKRDGIDQARSFKSHGALFFEDGEVRIQTRETPVLGAAIETDLRFMPRDVFNVVTTVRMIRFDVRVEPGVFQTIVIRASSRLEARAIAAQLPTAMTPEFAAESARMDRFLDGMESRTPHVWVTWVLVIVNVLVYLKMSRLGGSFSAMNGQIVLAFGSNFGPDTLGGQWWRLVTNTFIHFNLVHLTFNMVVLLQMGRIAERLFGNARFAALYFFTGVAASLTSLCVHPVMNSAGASGAIFGVLGALLAYVIRCRASMPESIQAKRFRTAGFIVVYSLFNGVTHHGVDNAAHVGGLFAGFLVGWLLARPVDDVESTRDSRDAVLFSTSLGLFVIAALVFLAIRVNSTPQARQEIAFAAVERQIGLDQQKLSKDIAAVTSMARNPNQRDAVLAKIHTEIWPECNAAYERVNHTTLPPGSRFIPLRTAQLRYYDDMRQAWVYLADVETSGRLPDATMDPKLKAVVADAKVQHALVAKLLARW